MNMNSILSSITSIDQNAAAQCMSLFDRVAKPIGSLGKLEELICQIAAVKGSAEIDISKKAVALFCADNGVTRQGVASGGYEITTAIAGMIGLNKASVSIMAKNCGAEVFSTDVGMVEDALGLRKAKLMQGTCDITKCPAMSRETAVNAIEIGIKTVKELKEKGFGIIASGEAGIGNTTTASAICSCMLNRPAKEVTGRGAGLDDTGLARKILVIEQALEKNRPDPSDPLDVLHKVGGLDIAAMTGLFIGGAVYKVPIVMDGFISGAAALLAVGLCPKIRGYILPSHESGEPGASLILKKLDFSPIIQCKMRLGEGTGAVALFPLLDMALAVCREAATFDDIQVYQYKRNL